MTERITRSKTGKTPSKPVHPGFVETPGRKKYTRKSIIPDHGLNDAIEGVQDASTSTAAELTSSNGSLTANGDANGKLNGHTTGHTNGTANGTANGPANGVANGHARKESKGATDYENFGPYDTSGEREFGGSFGMLAMMTGFPALMYYMWIGAFFYDGKFPKPAPGQSYGQFFEAMWTLVKTEAFPTARAWKIYWVFGTVQLAFYMFLPGIWRKGKALPHLGGKQLDYYCSAMWSFYTSIALALLLDFTGTFKIFTLIEEFGSIMSVAIISGFGCSLIAYVSAIARGATIRMTGWPIYDYFLGAELNPRLFGIVDIKMFLEVRIPWFMMFFMTLGTCIKQYEVYGYVSAPALFMLLAHWLYANSCAKGEHLIITTWDMYYEKLGFMLIFWNMAGVPLSYCHCTLFIARHDPTTYAWPTWVYVLMAISYLGVYYVWDTTNSQKNQFRQEERGVVDERTTFPYFRYGRIANPKTIPTKQGNKILCDGWYGKARKIHYPCDAFFAICWGLVTGFNSAFPWFYSVFFCLMIIHRARRDIEKCRKVYGEAWTEYEKRVPYLFIPYVY